MFGIVYLLGQAIASALSEAKDNYENYKCKQKYTVDKKGLTYINNKGQHLFINNEHPVFTKFDKQTEKIRYIDMKTQQVVEEFYPDATLKSIELHKQWAQEKGRTAYVSEWDALCFDDHIIRQNLYRDVQTYEEYVVRKIRDRYYYVSTKTMLVVRETDTSKRKILNGNGILDQELTIPIDVHSFRVSGFPEVSFDKDLCDWTYG